MSMGPSQASSSAALKRSRSPSADRAVAPSSTNTNAAVKSILNSRKCWRSLKGKEEPVWPPQLEAALIEGLERYKPSESKSTRTLGRFPMRNKFVADHIFETTGVRRTPKQVGSRIQQLRDTQSGKQILKVISDRHYEMMHPSRPSSSRVGSGATACALQNPGMMPTLSPSHIWVKTLPASAAWRFGSYPPSTGDLHSSMPRPLRLINPTVTFSSLSQAPCQSIFTVYRHGELVHREVAPVSITASTSGPAATPCWLYSTTLVPKYWAHLCDTEDPTSYAVHQEVMRVPLSTHAPPLLSVCYHFVHGGAAQQQQQQHSPPPLSPRSSSGASDASSSLSRESSPTYPHDVDAKPYAFPGGAGASPLVFAPYDTGSPASPLDLRAASVGVDGWPYGLQDSFGACDPIFDPYINL